MADPTIVPPPASSPGVSDDTKPCTRGRAARRNLRLFALACIAADLLVLAGRSTWETHSPDEYLERVRGCSREPRDVIFLGGSTVAEGIDPDQVCPLPYRGQTYTNGYTLGLPGGTTSDFYFALRKACPTPPRLLIYGMTASDFNDSRHEPHGAHTLMDWADVQDWRRTRPDAADWIVRHYLRGQASQLCSTYHYRHGIRMWAATLCQDLVPGGCPESFLEAKRHREQTEALRQGRGYAPTLYFWNRRYSDMKADGWVAPPFEYLARYRTGSHLKYLVRLLDWAEEVGTAVILMEMPVTADLEDRHASEFAEFRRRVDDVTAGRKVARVSMHREVARLNDDHFADIIHLNRTGANVLSAWIKHTFTHLLPDSTREAVITRAQAGQD